MWCMAGVQLGQRIHIWVGSNEEFNLLLLRFLCGLDRFNFCKNGLKGYVELVKVAFMFPKLVWTLILGSTEFFKEKSKKEEWDNLCLMITVEWSQS